MPPRSRKDDLSAAAEREFAAAGYSGSRVERIVAAAGVNKQLLFHYFGSKNDLFLTLLGQLLARSEPPAAAADEHPASDIRAVVAALQGAAREWPSLAGILADAGGNDGFPAQAAQLVGAWRSRQLRRLRRAIEEGQRRGHFRDDVDPAALAAISLAAALGAGTVPGEPLPIAAVLTDYCAWR